MDKVSARLGACLLATLLLAMTGKASVAAESAKPSA